MVGARVGGVLHRQADVAPGPGTFGANPHQLTPTGSLRAPYPSVRISRVAHVEPVNCREVENANKGSIASLLYVER